MKKQAYQKPTMKVVKLSTKPLMYTVSNVKTNGLDSSEGLNYNRGGGDMEEAW